MNFFKDKEPPLLPLRAITLMTKYNIPEGKELGKKLKMIEERWVDNNFEISEKDNLVNFDIQREEIERKLIDFSFKTKTPLIGVCRGMQALGLYYGVKLFKIENHVKS